MGWGLSPSGCDMDFIVSPGDWDKAVPASDRRNTFETSPNTLLKMPWPAYLSNGCRAVESSAGLFPQPIPSIP